MSSAFTLIASVLWGLLLRPLLTTAAVWAQQPVLLASGPPLASQPVLVIEKNWVYVAADGYLTHFPCDGDSEVSQAGRSFPYPGKVAVTR